MDDFINVDKPTKKDIELWIANKLDKEQMKRVAAGLLIYKDSETQDILEHLLLENLNFSTDICSNLAWVKDTLSQIFSDISKSLRDDLRITMTDTPPQPLYLGTENQEETQDAEDITYTISAQSKSDLRLFIKIPKGKYLITTMFVNSEEDMGFLYPDRDCISNLEDLVNEGEKTMPIIDRDYDLEEKEINFIVTRCPAKEKHLKYFMHCIQEMEEISVIRWLRYIKQNESGDFNIANIKFQKKD